MIVHGIGTSHRYSALLHRALATSGSTYSLDLPGFGGTETPRRQLSVADNATLLSSVLRTLMHGLRVRQCVVIGHSMGAQIATELAVQHPELVSHLVLIGPVTDSRRCSVLAQAIDLCRDTLKEPVAANLLVFADYARCGPWWYTRTLVSMLAFATADRIVHVAAPILVMRGADDPVSRQAWCAGLVRRSRNGMLSEIAGHRHLVHYSAAGSVAGRISRFVQNS
ncbi:alpha/beta fold hydrolase [Cryobacterium frigoriphilum]|uniref:alpha/beta fold hydrolase n=1 Tax=Cryobacterium frigoriphilum TaxID=1259150 RepID=UPI00141BE4BC|nr:alpha/beta hydrolase [Cryobacterium frigoriphilum]